MLYRSTRGVSKIIISFLSDLPEFVDWRTKGVITPIKNQKHCGSCWTFSTTGTLEAHTCLKNPDLDCTTWAGLAEQQLLDCASKYMKS
jgi:C1A family cysteine protease